MAARNGRLYGGPWDEVPTSPRPPQTRALPRRGSHWAKSSWRRLLQGSTQVAQVSSPGAAWEPVSVEEAGAERGLNVNHRRLLVPDVECEAADRRPH